MINLNFPKYTFKIFQKKNQFYIFCPSKGKHFLLTPEEWVRQHTIEFLIKEKNYSPSSINVEVSSKLYHLKKRIDILAYKKQTPYLIVECKSPTILLSQKVVDQICRYDLIYKATYLMITNGLSHLYFHIDSKKSKIIFLKDLPNFN